MKLFTLHTYHGLKGLRKIQEKIDVVPFIFGETLTLFKDDSEVCIDISALIHLLRVNNENLYVAYVNMREMDDDTVVILEETLAEDALVFFPFLFKNHESYVKSESPCEEDIPHNSTPCCRRLIYTYNNDDDLTTIINYTNKNNIPLATFSHVSDNVRNEFERFNKSAMLALLDLTSVSYALEENKNLIYPVEQFLNVFSNTKVIVLASQVDTLLQYFPLYLENHEPLCNLITELTPMGTAEPEDYLVKKVTNLSQPEFKSFVEQFKHNLIGHEYFKERLGYSLKNFIALNRVKDQKVFSIFLFGTSGIGKTEVARLIANSLLEDCYLAKINFQNYSSQDALNSLIGSPAGYVGCNHGELSEKVQKSKVGVLLCDEFEKTTRPVFSFFLELLEEGKFTDSMTREYDLDGYVIVFTSNIPDESEYRKTIPPELQTRFDLVCEFEEPSPTEKTEFLDLLLEKAHKKYVDQFARIKMTADEKQQLYDFDYSRLSALRDIKRIFNNRLMDFFNSKGV